MTPRQHRTLAHVSAIMAARAWLRPFVRCGAQGRLVCATTMNCGALLSSVSGPRCGVCALRSGLPSCMLTRQRCVVCSRESVVGKFVRTAWLCEMVQCASIPECVAGWHHVHYVCGARVSHLVCVAAGPSKQEKNTSLALYLFAGAIGFVGLSYASVPLYQMFCQATGYGGTTQTSTLDKLKEMKPVSAVWPGACGTSSHVARASTGSWCTPNHHPLHRQHRGYDAVEVRAPAAHDQGACPVCLPGGGHVGSRDAWMQVVPGEPALACYTAYNPTKRPITGVATYNVTPQKCGVYFTKYQCFCFDEQRLRPKEEIDMPVGGCSLIRWITAQFGDTHRCFSDSCYSGWTRRFWRIPSWETYAISRCPTPSSRRMKKMRKMTVVTTPSPSLLLVSSA